ncbi:MAG: hypothetical protein L7F78_16705 [Syntrophales bacterium LBB04]|nr:hypothetical protein [Syntrophales bacterium LBB04]
MLTDLDPYLSSLKDRKYSIFGSGALKYAERINSIVPNAIIAPANYSYVKADLVAALGVRKLYDGCMTDPLNLVPHYLHLSEAERKQLTADSLAHKTSQ